MKRNLFRLCYALSMVLASGWLFFSNQIIDNLSQNNQIEEVEFKEYPAKDRVIFHLDEVRGFNDLTETLRVSGWGFVETELNNEKAWTDVILVNDKYCYRLGCRDMKTGPYVTRQDVVEAYQEYKIPNADVGFVNNYSSFVVADGTYDIYIYRWENEQNYGLVHTKKQLVKNREEIVYRDQPLREQIVSPIDSIPETLNQNIQVKGRIDSAKLKEEVLVISGWAFAVEGDSNDQKIYLQLQNDSEDMYFELNSTGRRDVANVYGKQYIYSGFEGIIDPKNLRGNQWTATILVGKGDAYTPVQSVILRLEDEEVILE